MDRGERLRRADTDTIPTMMLKPTATTRSRVEDESQPASTPMPE